MKNVFDFLFVFTNGFGVITGFLLSLFFFRKKKITDHFLATLILVITIRVLKSLIYYFHPELNYSIINITFALKLSIGPLLLIYLQFFIGKRTTLKTYDFIHLIPSFIMIVGSPFITHDTLNPFGFLFIYFQLLGYILYSRKTLKRLNEFKRIEWGKRLVNVLLIIWCAYFAQLFFKQVHYLTGSFLYSISLMYLTFKANTIGSFSKAVLHEEKYESSKLDNETKYALLNKVKTYMDQSKPYLNPDVSLSSFAENVGATAHELSEIINTEFESNFNQFINAYRIEYAKKLLVDQNKKVAESAFEVGFKSLSTFNSTFKKIVGYTPSEYRKNLRNHNIGRK